MCLGIPGKLVEISREDPICPMAMVNFGELTKEICIAYTPEAKPGDYLLVHVGFAITVLDQAEAKRVIKTLDTLEFVDDIQ